MKLIKVLIFYMLNWLLVPLAGYLFFVFWPDFKFDQLYRILSYFFYIITLILFYKNELWNFSQGINFSVNKTDIFFLVAIAISLNVFFVLLSFQESTGSNFDKSIFSILRLVILTPFIEELIYRRIFFTELENYNKWFVLIFVSFLFGLDHLVSIYYFFVAFSLSLVIGLIWIRTKNFMYVYLLHSFYNMSAFIGFSPFYNFSSNIEIVIVAITVLIILVFLLKRFFEVSHKA